MVSLSIIMFSFFVKNPLMIKSFFLHNMMKHENIYRKNIKNNLATYSKKTNKLVKNIEFSQIEDNLYSEKERIKNCYIPKTTTQEKYCEYLNNTNVSIVVAVGPAGTGKTLLACNDAIKKLKNNSVKKIIITRPVVSVDDEEIGFLPGNINKKMEPWTRPIFDVFSEYFSTNEINKMIFNNIIEISPLAYMRGRTFKNTYVIADEMQNSSPNQMMMLTTRIGEKSKIVITGDLKQNDKKNELSGLDDFIDKYKNYGVVEEIKIIELNSDDIQRSPVVLTILNIYSGVSSNVTTKTNMSISKTNFGCITNNDAALIPIEAKSFDKIKKFLDL